MSPLTDIELPSPPHTALRLIQLCADPRASTEQIVAAVSPDAALSAKFMRVANAPYYGQQYEVTTLPRAAIVMGADQMKVVALGFHLAEVSRQCRDLPIDLRPTWQGNLLRACLARRLAMHALPMPARHPGEAFLVGLLQDFAIPIAAKAVGEAYGSFVEQGGLYSTNRTLQSEETVIGTNHAHLAGRLLDAWRLHPMLSFAIVNHHVRPASMPATDKAMALWQIAYWVGAIPFRDDGATAPVARELRDLAYGAFGLRPERLAEAFYGAIDEYEASAPLFDGVLPPDVDGAYLIQQARDLIVALDTCGKPDSRSAESP